jgi:hypothetical protein
MRSWRGLLVSWRQDNDLIVIESAGPAAFKRAFDARFAGGDVLRVGAKR